MTHDGGVTANESDVNESLPFVGKNGYVNFVAEITGQTDTCINVTVNVVTSWDENRVPSESELYCKAYLKWDGCCHLWFGQESNDGKSDGYLHLCGVAAWQEHVAVMRWLYELAGTRIARFCNEERWVD